MDCNICRVDKGVYSRQVGYEVMPEIGRPWVPGSKWCKPVNGEHGRELPVLALCLYQ
jgi:hypothetical protein